MSKITLKKKSLVSGMISLYLDYYPGLPDPQTGKLVGGRITFSPELNELEI